MKSFKILVGFIMDGKAGGIDKYLLNFLEQVHSESIQIDFLTNSIHTELQNKLAEFDCNLYQVATLKNADKQYEQICELIKKNQYDMTYFNISTAISRIGPKAAFDCNVPIRAIHSHSTGNDCSNKYKRKILDYLHKKYKKQIYKTANRFFACSKEAGLWMFPQAIVNSNQFKVIHNAIDTKKFAFDENVRKTVRQELGLTDKFVIGHVGNFCYQKNQERVVDIFHEVIKKNHDARLLFVGTGPDLDMIKEIVRSKNIEDKVKFLGRRTDVDHIMQAMDVFLFPSRFEGLGIVLVEAQAAGLPCITSAVVPREVAITNTVEFLSLDESTDTWANKILQFLDNDTRVDNVQKIIDAGYDLAQQKDEYLAIISQNNNL